MPTTSLGVVSEVSSFLKAISKEADKVIAVIQGLPHFNLLFQSIVIELFRHSHHYYQLKYARSITLAYCCLKCY